VKSTSAHNNIMCVCVFCIKLG